MSLHSLLVPARAAALCTVDGVGGREELHPPGERGDMSQRTRFSTLRTVVHGGGSWRASRACFWVGLHVGGPSTARQQVSWPSGL